MQEQIALQKLLRERLLELQSRNPSYSVRAFASRLGLQPAATNEILKGERRVSRKMAERIARKLMLDPTERSELLRHFPERARRKAQGLSSGELQHADVLKLSADQFQALSDWLHFGILNLIGTADFRLDPEWIAERFAVTPARVEAALERLRRLHLVEDLPEGGIKRTYARLNTTDDSFDLSIQKSHLMDLELAQQALREVPVELRDFTSLTFPAAPALLAKAKEAIRRAQDEISDLLASEPTTEVYRMTTHLFPLSRRKETQKTRAVKPSRPKPPETEK